MKYIDADKLIAEIERLYDIARDASYNGEIEGEMTAYDKILSLIASLQQERQETDMKSPFTGGKVAILSRQEEVTFRGEKVKILRKYYRCEDTGRKFTNDKLDDDMMWAVFRAYCEKKGMTSFTDIMLKQEQPYAIGGVVHHALGAHWVVANQEQLCAHLKQFPEGAEVEILIEARKEDIVI